MKSKMTCCERRVFLLTGYASKEREELKQLISSLPEAECAQVQEEFGSSDCCTHVVCPKPAKSEKFLGGIITGKWLVHTSYIRASHRAGRWLNELEYEWSPNLAHLATSETHQYLKTPRKWRERISSGQPGPFAGWSVGVLVENPMKKIVYNRLLKLGGANLLERDVLLKRSHNLRDLVTHLFVDADNARKLKYAHQVGVLCLDPLYIGDFLMKESPPNPRNYCALPIKEEIATPPSPNPKPRQSSLKTVNTGVPTSTNPTNPASSTKRPQANSPRNGGSRKYQRVDQSDGGTCSQRGSASTDSSVGGNGCSREIDTDALVSFTDKQVLINGEQTKGTGAIIPKLEDMDPTKSEKKRTVHKVLNGGVTMHESKDHCLVLYPQCADDSSPLNNANTSDEDNNAVAAENQSDKKSSTVNQQNGLSRQNGYSNICLGPAQTGYSKPTGSQHGLVDNGPSVGNTTIKSKSSVLKVKPRMGVKAAKLVGAACIVPKVEKLDSTAGSSGDSPNDSKVPAFTSVRKRMKSSRIITSSKNPRRRLNASSSSTVRSHDIRSYGFGVIANKPGQDSSPGPKKELKQEDEVEEIETKEQTTMTTKQEPKEETPKTTKLEMVEEAEEEVKERSANPTSKRTKDPTLTSSNKSGSNSSTITTTQLQTSSNHEPYSTTFPSAYETDTHNIPSMCTTQLSADDNKISLFWPMSTMETSIDLNGKVFSPKKKIVRLEGGHNKDLHVVPVVQLHKISTALLSDDKKVLVSSPASTSLSTSRWSTSAAETSIVENGKESSSAPKKSAMPLSEIHDHKVLVPVLQLEKLDSKKLNNNTLKNGSVYTNSIVEKSVSPSKSPPALLPQKASLKHNALEIVNSLKDSSVSTNSKVISPEKSPSALLPQKACKKDNAEKNPGETNWTVKKVMRKLEKQKLKLQYSEAAPVFPQQQLNPQPDQLDKNKKPAEQLESSSSSSPREIPDCRTNLFETLHDSDMFMQAIEQVASHVTARRYPQPQTLSKLLSDYVINPKTDEPNTARQIQNSASNALHTVLSLHPPSNSRMQKYYFYVLTKQKENKNFLADVIRNCMTEDKPADKPDDKSADKPGGKPGDRLALKYLMSILEADYLHYTLKINAYNLEKKKHQAVDHTVKRPRPCLLAQLIWTYGHLDFGHMNNDIRDLMGCLLDTAQKGQDDELVAILCRLVTMAIESSRHAANRFCSSPGLLPPNNPLDIIHQLACKMAVRGMTSEVLQDVINCINQQSPWITVELCEALLDYYDDALVQPQYRNVYKPCSLEKIVCRYFWLLPQCNRSTTSSPNKSAQRNTSGEKQKLTKSETVSNINKPNNKKGETSLHTACIHNRISQLKELLNTPGIDVNVVDNAGWTPLHEAANRGHLECVQLLLDFRPSIVQASTASSGRIVDIFHAENHQKITALHDAVINDCPEVVSLLLQHGGRKLYKMKDKEGKTALDHAENDAMIDTLKAAEASFNNTNNRRWAVPDNSNSDLSLCLVSEPDLAVYDRLVNCENGPDQLTRYVYLLRTLLLSYLNLHNIVKIYNLADNFEDDQQNDHTPTDHSNLQSADACTPQGKDHHSSPPPNSAAVIAELRHFRCLSDYTALLQRHVTRIADAVFGVVGGACTEEEKSMKRLMIEAKLISILTVAPEE